MYLVAMTLRAVRLVRTQRRNLRSAFFGRPRVTTASGRRAGYVPLRTVAREAADALVGRPCSA